MSSGEPEWIPRGGVWPMSHAFSFRATLGVVLRPYIYAICYGIYDRTADTHNEVTLITFFAMVLWGIRQNYGAMVLGDM